MKLSAFVLVSALAFAAGCTSNPTSHTQNTTFSPKPEHAVKEGKSIYIAKGFNKSHTEKGFFSEPFAQGLVEGRYIAELRDEYGIYYRGPRQCVFLDVLEHPERSMRLEGGLYVPNSGTNKDAVIYFYMNSDSKPDGTSVPTGMDYDHPYLQGQAARDGSVDGSVGAALGGAITHGIISSLTGKISFIPFVETKPLMHLVKPE